MSGETPPEHFTDEELAAQPRIPCPFVYSDGRQCPGHVVRIEAYKADIQWALGDDGRWTFGWHSPRSHYHLFCSKKGNHAGWGRADSDQLKFYYDRLPEELKRVIAETG